MGGRRGASRMQAPSWIVILCLCHLCSDCFSFQCSTSPPGWQVAELKVCPPNNQTDQPQLEDRSANACTYTTSPPLTPCPALSPDTPCWRTVGTSGVVEVEFPLLPLSCDYTSYVAKLIVSETENQDCRNKYDIKVHSTREVYVVDCEGPSCANNCTQRALLTFQHVFSGCYQLVITPYEYKQPRIFNQLETRLVHINTGHVKTDIHDDAVLMHRKSSVSLSVKAILTASPTSSRFTLMQDVDKSIGADACRMSGTCIATCDMILGSRHIQCNSGNKRLNVSCNYQDEGVVSCEFSHLKNGNYCVRLTFDDDRCRRSTVWDNLNHSYSMCAWESDVLEFISAESGTESAQAGAIDPLLLTLLIVIILVSCGIGWWVIQNRVDAPHHKFSPVQTVTTHVTEHHQLLLLYARDCPTFLDAVAQLRILLKTACKCEVLDCWEESQYQRVAQGPTRWLMSLLTDGKVRIVLVTSPVSSRIESALVSGHRVYYKQPKAFDSVLIQVLNYLHDTYSYDTYKSLFLIRLQENSRDGAMPHTGTFLNPLTIYELPVHLNALLANLQNMNPTECKISEGLKVDVSRLTTTISEYRQYLNDHPRYLDSLLITESGSSLG